MPRVIKAPPYQILKLKNFETEIGTYWIAEFRTYIDQPKNLLRWESAIYHLIKLSFEAEVARNSLNGIYYISNHHENIQHE